MGRRPVDYAGLSDDELTAALVSWFERHGERRDAWNRTAVGRELKLRLTALGRFKHLPRGDPVKGHAAMLKRLAEDGVAPTLPASARSAAGLDSR